MACSSNVELPEEDLILTITDKGITVTTCKIALNSRQYKVLLDYFSSNPDWAYAPATYLPNKLITAKGFKANFTRKAVVINDAYTSTTTPEIYEGLVCK